jgi:hypothetical protein
MYLEGDQEIPDSVLLRAIDIIIEICRKRCPIRRTQLDRKAEAPRRSAVRFLVAPGVTSGLGVYHLRSSTGGICQVM